MSGYLLTLTIGPVQGFISAARRTRDLWFGSHLLAKISQAAAKAVYDAGGDLIFPAHQTLAESEKNDAGCNISNIILAELPEGLEPGTVARTAESAAKKRWEDFAKDAYDVAGDLINPTIWSYQLNDVIEFYAAWGPLPLPDCYADIRNQLTRLLAGRKACRDFLPTRGHPIPKSSLDGARESVFIERRQRKAILEKNKKLAQRLRLNRGEELDIVGLTKRAATGETFSSVVRVAADPWIRGIEQDGGKALAALKAIANECLKVMDYSNKDTAHVTGTGEHYRHTAFRYDGAVLYPSRLDSMLRFREDEVDILTQKDREVFEEIRKKLPLLQNPKELGYGEPDPYLAILIADGDRMGRTISQIKSAEKHQDFSRQLAQFAEAAGQIVQKNHKGCLVYSGGDDVLAFVPVDQCLDCARALHDEFGKSLETWLDDEGKSPTLSVGIAIGHCLEHLEDLLNYARAAEKAAKKPDRDGLREPDRDGLAVHLHSRSGPPVKVRAQWISDLDKRLLRWAGMHLNEQISDKTVYGLRMLARDYAGWPATVETDKVIEKDIQRLLSRKQAGGQKLDPAALEADLDRCFERANHTLPQPHQEYHPGVMRLADEWLIARRLAKVIRQAAGKNALLREGMA